MFTNEIVESSNNQLKTILSEKFEVKSFKNNIQIYIQPNIYLKISKILGIYINI